MEQAIHVCSEIGRLRKVLLHRPGGELENLMPEYLERLLFDDIPYLEEARREHDLEPLAAHLDYDDDERVIGLITRGIGQPETAPVVKERCTWLEVGEDLR